MSSLAGSWTGNNKTVLKIIKAIEERPPRDHHMIMATSLAYDHTSNAAEIENDTWGYPKSQTSQQWSSFSFSWHRTKSSSDVVCARSNDTYARWWYNNNHHKHPKILSWRVFWSRGMHWRLPAYGVGRGGVGEGLPELKFSSIILSFKTSRCWLSLVYYLSTQFPWSEGLCEPKFKFCLHLAYLFDVSGQVQPSSMINNLHMNTYFILTF